MTEMLEKTFKEIEEFIQESKPVKKQINFKRKQLQFLKADVKKPKIPLKIGFKIIERKKLRRKKNLEQRLLLDNYKKKNTK